MFRFLAAVIRFLLNSAIIFDELYFMTGLSMGFIDAEDREGNAELKKSHGNAPWLLTIGGCSFFIFFLPIELLVNKKQVILTR